jgi:antitoxin PrlF
MQLHYFVGMKRGPAVNATAIATLVAESTLTDRYQTTVPDSIRRALSLGKRDKIRFSLLPDGRVTVERVSPGDEHDDPVLGAFLGFLTRDIEQHPERLRAFDCTLREHITGLVGHVAVDLDAPLTPDDA